MQAWPHVPQLAASVPRSTHAAAAPSPHTTLPTRHAQVPCWHAAPEAHELVQPPQCDGFELVSVHAPEHTISAPGQVQTLASHVWPVAQRFRHAPQFDGSVPVFTHLGPGPVQVVAPASHVHAPALQEPRPQGTSQAPQCDESVVRSTQASPHAVSVPGHTHTPPVQDAPGGHA